MTEHQLIRVRVPEGRVVPNLDTGAGNITSAPEGELVRRTRFVERRLADGDLVQVEGDTEHDAAPAAEGDV